MDGTLDVVDENPEIFVVIPAFNEANTLQAVLRGLNARYQSVVVDDGSQDDTYEIAKRDATHALRHLINRGQGAALQTGIDFALRRGAEFVVTFDADGQHRVEDIEALLDPIRQGECEITLGSRFLGEAVDLPLTRRVILKLGVLFTRIFSRVRLSDSHNGLRAFSRRAALKIDLKLDRMAHASEIIDIIRRSGMPYREIPVRVLYTKKTLAKGQSSLGAVRIAVEYLTDRILR